MGEFPSKKLFPITFQRIDLLPQIFPLLSKLYMNQYCRKMFCPHWSFFIQRGIIFSTLGPLKENKLIFQTFLKLCVITNLSKDFKNEAYFTICEGLRFKGLMMLAKLMKSAKFNHTKIFTSWRHYVCQILFHSYCS